MIRFRPATGEEFLRLRGQSTRERYMDRLSADQLDRIAAEGGVVLVADGLACGFAVTDDGDLGNIFNASGKPGLGRRAALEAIRLGARSLNCFDGFLAGYYRGLGFVETGRVPFDPALAPADWDRDRDGSPDVVFMALPASEVAA